jgi:phosphate-selective porin OprO/OprP
MIMSRTKWLAATAIGAIGIAMTSGAQAQSAGGQDAEIALLKQQLKLMEQKLDKLQQQTSANTTAAANASAKAEAAKTEAAKVEPRLASLGNTNANAAYPVKGPGIIPDAVVHMPNNRPTICTVDEQNCVSITSRVHWDVGGYDYRPNTSATSPQKLDDGENLRRARIGVIGKFAGDWNYALVYDFGGSSDGFASAGSFGAALPATGGTAVGFLPGGAVAGVENAYLSYTGFNPFGGKLAIEGGVLDLPYTMDEATSSNDILFMERASSGIVAQNIAAGDFRSAAGARWFNDRLWAGGYVTGPTTGAIHSASSLNPNGTTEQVGAIARVAGQLLSGNGYSLHLGGEGEWLIRAPRNEITGAQTLTLSDRPELRLDPTSLISTGALAGVSGSEVYSVEAAGNYGPLFAQGEYFWFNVDRGNNPIPLSDVKFDGGYAEVAYALTGEMHKYPAGSAYFGGIGPLHPLSFT